MGDPEVSGVARKQSEERWEVNETAVILLNIFSAYCSIEDGLSGTQPQGKQA